MSLAVFALSLVVPAALVWGVLGYLNPVLRAVLTELGASDQGAEFWLRTAASLAVIGSVMLVLLGGDDAPDLGEFLRGVVLRAMFASFAAVAFIAFLVWRAHHAICHAREEGEWVAQAIAETRVSKEA